jgi:hypothetical protein
MQTVDIASKLQLLDVPVFEYTFSSHALMLVERSSQQQQGVMVGGAAHTELLQHMLSS